MSVMLVIVLQEVIVCNLNKIIFLNLLFHGEAENFLNYPRISSTDKIYAQIPMYEKYIQIRHRNVNVLEMFIIDSDGDDTIIFKGELSGNQ